MAMIIESKKVNIIVFLSMSLLFSISRNAESEIFVPPEPFWWHAKVSRDPAMRTSDYPFLTSDTLRSFCDHIFDETRIPFDTEAVKDGDTIYVIGPFLEQFIYDVSPKIQAKYILVSHFGPIKVPGSATQFLKSENLAFWVSLNIVDPLQNPKFVPIPVGLAPKNIHYADLSIVETLINSPKKEKKHLLYLNHWDGTNQNERNGIRNLFENKKYCYVSERKPFAGYMEDLASSYFVISPPGAGLDCYRNWEAMLVDCIPIVLHSPLDYLFEDLPVLIIDDWNELTEDFLLQKLKEISAKPYNREKLFAEYWLNVIRNCQMTVRNEINLELKLDQR
jgi:hypothetical protein